MIDANDGGVDLQRNGGETWNAPPLPIAQFYHVAGDNRVPYHVTGAMQDIGTAQGPSNTWSAPASASPTGTASAAARRATSSPTRPTPTSSTPASTSATSRATTTAPATSATSARGPRTPPATAART